MRLPTSTPSLGVCRVYINRYTTEHVDFSAGSIQSE